MPLEKQIVNRIVKNANARPECYARKIHGSRYQAGFPDIIICQGGELLMVEAKQPGRKATPLQLRELGRWQAAGAEAMVAFRWEDVEERLDSMIPGSLE